MKKQIPSIITMEQPVQQQDQSLVQEYPPLQTETNNKKPLPQILVGILVVLIVLGFGIYAKYGQSNSAQTNSNPNQAFPVPTDWKTYANKEEAFQLSYPSQFVPDVNADYPASGSVIAAFRRPSYGDWTFSVSGAYHNETFEDGVQTEIKFHKDQRNFQQKSITVAGRKAQEFSFIEDTRDQNIENINIYIPKDNGSYFSINWKSSERMGPNQIVANDKNDLDLILGSFKFINKQAAVGAIPVSK